MKEKTALLLLFVYGISLCASAKVAKNVCVEFNDPSIETKCYDRLQIKGITFDANPYEMEVDGHRFVYLGKVDANGNPTEKTWWAETNVGASSPQEYGNYFSWGETSQREVRNYTLETDPLYDSSASSYTYTSWNLDKAHDVASQLWGENCRTPTASEWENLSYMKQTDGAWVWSASTIADDTHTDGGYTITSPTTNMSIFLPASGYYDGNTCSGQGSEARYWSSSLEALSNAYYMLLNKTDCYVAYYGGRYCGNTVRAVASIDENSPAEYVKKVNIVFRDGSSISYDRSIVKKITFTEEVSLEMVDLGITSGGKKLLWANQNIGAKTSAEFGSYFAWGDTSTKSEYRWSTYEPNGGGGDFLPEADEIAVWDAEHTTNKVLKSDADAATINWGDNYRMPTKEEWQALVESSDLEWVLSTGAVSETSTQIGYTIKNKSTGNSIFLPATGYISESTYCERSATDFCIKYWSSSLLDSDHEYDNLTAYILNCERNSGKYKYEVSEEDRYIGLPVRAVSEQSE